MSRQNVFTESQNPNPNGRRIVHFQHLGIPDVVSLGHYAYYAARPGLTSHSHPGSVEICYLERGSQIYRAEGRKYRLTGGDLFVTKPGEPHDTGGQTENCGILYWLILKVPEKGGSLLTLPATDSVAMVAKLSLLPKRHFPGSPVVKQVFNRLFKLYDEPVHELTRVTVINLLQLCILEVLDCANRNQPRRCSPAMERIIERILSSPEEELPLLKLAEESNLSLSRFKARFKAETGIGPHEFILRTKLEAAMKVLLRGNGSVTDVAMQFGFSSSQYFATVFRRFTRLRPIQFRAAAGRCLPPLRDGNV